MLGDDDDFVPIDEAATRMGLTTEQVMELVTSGGLRARRYGGWGQVEVEPAIVNMLPTPKKKAAPAKRASSRARTK
jgi:hypothetical protein